MLAAATVPHSSSGSAWTLHVDTSSRHKMIICAFFLARPPETSFKAVNKQVSLDSPLSITTVCHFISPPRAEIRVHHILLVAYPGCFHATYPEAGNPPHVLVPQDLHFPQKKSTFSKKDMSRALSSSFTLHILLLLMSCSIKSCSIM